MLIHITGPPGSGKSHIGSKLSKLPNTVIIDTDEIFDEHGLKILHKYHFRNLQNEDAFYAEIKKMNDNRLKKILKDAKDKGKNIVFVGLNHDGLDLDGIVDHGFVINISSAQLFKQYNLRTLDAIQNKYNEIKKLLGSDKNVMQIVNILVLKYKIRTGLVCHYFEDIKKMIDWCKSNAKKTGYQYKKSSDIIKSTSITGPAQ